MASSSALPVLPSKTDQVFDLIRARILDGRLQPDQRISMDELSRELGVSKIPVREAIGRLEALGFVTNKQHAGPAVAAVDIRQLNGAYLARAELEPLIARLAAQNASVASVRSLAVVHKHMSAALANGRHQLLADLNSEFHAGLAAMTGYAILGEIDEALLLAVRRYRVIDPLTTDNWARVVREHEIILDAVRAGDGTAAAAAARHHAESQAGLEFDPQP
ncbi:GntR family transcriptional regulator [Nakamurella sp. A5-74]|uniref:GntR family transcriptional regulator n=1 Tax=Nakamurella sp. A5-74 TaxID=3158264 RepID=A0AAU8DUK1_9ACTN